MPVELVTELCEECKESFTVVNALDPRSSDLGFFLQRQSCVRASDKL